jgi:hypothetical protein
MNNTLSCQYKPTGFQAHKNNISYQKILTLITLLWCLPSGLTLIDYNPAQIQNVTLIVGLITLGCMIWRPLYTLLALPFFALLSPAGGLFELFGVRAALTDWIMPVLVLRVVFSIFSSKGGLRLGVQKGTVSYYLTPLVGLYLASFMLSVLQGNVISGVSLYYLVSYAVIYVYFRRYARTAEDWQAIVWAWTLASLLGALILIQAFFAGKPLIYFADDNELMIDRQSIQHLFQASYYYAGFHFIAGIFSTSFLLRLIFGRESIRRKIVLLGLLLIFMTTLLAMVNKTAIYASLFSFVLLYLILSWRLRTINILLTVMISFFSMSAFVWFMSQYGVELYQSSDQLLNKLGSTSSFGFRAQVWVNAFQQIFARPWDLVIGLGPDVFGTGPAQLKGTFLVAADTGGQEGALDSSWLTYLFEFGVLGLLLLIALLAKAITICNRYLQHMPMSALADSSFLTVFGGLVFVIFAFVSQSIGYAKVSWLPFQLILIAFAYLPLLTGANTINDCALQVYKYVENKTNAAGKNAASPI